MEANACELYRKTKIGTSLTEALDELVSNGSIPPLLAMKILMQFDKSINEALQTRARSKVSFKGHLHTYRYYDNTWTFFLEKASFKTETEAVNVDIVKIVASDAKVPAR